MDPRTEKMLAEHAEKTAATPAPLRGPLSAVQNARRWTRTHAGETKLLAGAAVVLIFAAYYLVVTLPAQRADRMEMQARAAESVKVETTATHTAVSDCLAKVQAEADARWAAACKAKREGPNCPLPEHQADTYEHDESAARNACLIGH
jgi:type II secretory pathway component PulM